MTAATPWHPPLLLATLLLTLPLSVPATPSPASTPQSPGCPRECTCSSNNLTVDCTDSGFLSLPRLPGQVTHLDMSDNLLGPMINGSVEHLRNLRHLDLSGNGLLRLQLCTFTGLLHLRHLDLHGNRLRSLPGSLLADNGELEVLDLSHNDLDVLPDLLFHSVPLLKVLNVSHNHATLLKLGLRFQILTQLVVLDLSHNPFTNVSEDAFEVAETWNPQVSRTLDLSYCQLQDAHPRAVTAVPGLKTLSLAGNSLLDFQEVVDILKELENSGLEAVSLSNMTISNPALFAQVHLMALRELDLSRNMIASIPASTFGNIRSLQRLDVSGNLMTGLGEGFEDLVNLLHLNMSHCRLSSFKGSPVGRMQELTSLDLSHNALLDATEVALSPLRKLRLLDVSFNTLQSVVLPGDCSHLVTFNLASNALTTLPSMSNMGSLRFFDAHDNNLQSLSTFLFTEGRNIQVANFSNNDLTAIDHRVFLPSSPRVLDLSANLLTSTQFFSWTTTTELYLKYNKLNNLDQQTFYGMDQLRVLDLCHNNLSTISDETFKFLSNVTVLRLSNNSLTMHDFFPLLRNMESLQVLDLGHNQIKAINGSSFQRLGGLTSVSLQRNKMKVIPAGLFSDLEKLEEVDISGNPFDCDCGLLPLQEWLRETKVAVRQRFDLNVTNMCHTPPDQRGKAVTQFTVKQFQCDTKLLYMIIFGSIGALGIVIGIIASIICHYSNKCCKRHQAENDRFSPKRHKDDNSSRKDTNTNRVDLVRVSKRPDPYGKQDLINGWVASKQFTVAPKNLDPQYYRKYQQVPPRPPLPERKNTRSTKKEEKSRKEKTKEKEKSHHSKRESNDKKIRSVSELVPVRPPQQYVRLDRGPPAVPVWDEHYPQKNPVNIKRVDDRWAAIEMYPTWDPQHARRPAYDRDTGRFYTLPYPVSWQRYRPYGPDYPYRGRRQEEEEQLHRVRQSRALPYPPQNQDSRYPDPRPPAENRNGYDPYRNERSRDYDYLQTDRYRNEREERMGRQEMDVRHEHPEYQNIRRTTEDRPAGGNGQQADERQDRVEEKSGEQRDALKRGTSDAQIHRQDSDYRKAMDNPIAPKTTSSPQLAEDKASDWL